MPKALTPVEAFLAPLARVARAHRSVEGLVFWGGSGGWPATPSEALEPEEIVFYAEGLLAEGFGMEWTLVAEDEGGDGPGHLRLCFWQEGDPPPDLPPGWRAVERGLWPPGPPAG
jgi:hypothetical protein